MAEEPSLAELSWRMAQLERAQREQGETLERRFNALQHSIEGLQFVRQDVYASDQRALAEKVDGARSAAMWAIALVCSTAIGAIITGILALSGVFK